MRAVEVSGLSLAYRLSRHRSGTAKEHLFQALRRQVDYERLWALRDVSLTVAAGRVLGIVGPNGAGKTTLLKAITRVLPPTSGRVVVRGLVAPMIELGGGFDADLTGSENLVLYGAMLGHDPRALRRQSAAVAEWAELEDFMDVPLRSYSSGMLARLGFAVATLIQPDVLVVDEVLAVGDESFQRRSQERIAELLSHGTAVVLVSHALDTVRAYADEALWLDHGRVMAMGDPDEIVGRYVESVASAAA
jgi:ABC-2 type transport system ATP-binding protein